MKLQIWTQDGKFFESGWWPLAVVDQPEKVAMKEWKPKIAKLLHEFFDSPEGETLNVAGILVMGDHSNKCCTFDIKAGGSYYRCPTCKLPAWLFAHFTMFCPHSLYRPGEEMFANGEACGKISKPSTAHTVRYWGQAGPCAIIPRTNSSKVIIAPSPLHDTLHFLASDVLHTFTCALLEDHIVPRLANSNHDPLFGITRTPIHTAFNEFLNRVNAHGELRGNMQSFKGSWIAFYLKLSTANKQQEKKQKTARPKKAAKVRCFMLPQTLPGISIWLLFSQREAPPLSAPGDMLRARCGLLPDTAVSHRLAGTATSALCLKLYSILAAM